MDCSTDYGNQGCGGGFGHLAFAYVKNNHGIDTEESYPYEGRNWTCRYNPIGKGADDAGCACVSPGDEQQLQSAVANVGPISIAFDTSSSSFQFYSREILSDPNCHESNLNHEVLVVGYGSEQGYDYWLVKNSWDTTWGEDGYIRMLRNGDNYCGISSCACYPIIT